MVAKEKSNCLRYNEKPPTLPYTHSPTVSMQDTFNNIQYAKYVASPQGNLLTPVRYVEYPFPGCGSRISFPRMWQSGILSPDVAVDPHARHLVPTIVTGDENLPNFPGLQTQSIRAFVRYHGDRGR